MTKAQLGTAIVSYNSCILACLPSFTYITLIIPQGFLALVSHPKFCESMPLTQVLPSSTTSTCITIRNFKLII